jgi:hypothetical protein
MSLTYQQVADEAMKLTPEERADLAENSGSVLLPALTTAAIRPIGRGGCRARGLHSFDQGHAVGQVGLVYGHVVIIEATRHIDTRLALDREAVEQRMGMGVAQF